MTPESLRLLIDEARRGSMAAMGQLLDACRRYLLSVADRELPGRLQAKVSPSDIVQDTILDACRGFPQFDGQTDRELLAWLRRILLHNLGDVRRGFDESGKRKASREAVLAAGSSAGGMSAVAVSREMSPSVCAASREEALLLERALNRLGERDRTVLLLRNRDGLSFPAIAQYMGRSVDAVRKLWAGAVERLHKRLEPLYASR